MIKMPAKLKKKWLKALRSGEYGQIDGHLCDGNGSFCCLGVLEHVAMRGEVEVCDTGEFLDMPSNDFLKYARIKVESVHEEPIWCDETQNITNGGIDMVSLATLNDQGRTFQELAKVIEQKVETY